ncbi:ADP-ribosylhydrolase ARH3-like isoform X2 [Paramacrobiotus metropolitanus]|uniref:ADP-ribosylhydrolase ARH3-like isoform X2 n=1 Tax=Paramacrobiotus metropolitanus TaxID=2943436 RepID=UPI002445F21B|nr:ADP-ribosylhydrolase ARH3-like isoform X2 [Paramacrobiotus metropolitanus]
MGSSLTMRPALITAGAAAIKMSTVSCGNRSHAMLTRSRGCFHRSRAVAGGCRGRMFENSQLPLLLSVTRIAAGRQTRKRSLTTIIPRKYHPATVVESSTVRSAAIPKKDCQDRMLSKYRGCLLGALVGDCLGRMFEGARPPLQVAEIEAAIAKQKEHSLPSTDDTAMCHAIAESLIRCGHFDARNMAKSFVDKYEDEWTKQFMYTVGVKVIFAIWQANHFAGDVFSPARQQFDGRGSFCNGGGVRIASVPLFCGNRREETVEIARLSTQLTHNHPLGYNGAILQALAVHLALHSDTPDGESLLDALIDFASDSLETNERKKLYTNRLRIAKMLLNDANATQKDVIEKMEHSVNMLALDAIPMAIFCAARALRPITGIETDNPFARTILYAISMGGDTEAIATMAGAISGAWLGVQNIQWEDLCEAPAETLKQGFMRDVSWH